MKGKLLSVRSWAVTCAWLGLTAQDVGNEDRMPCCNEVIKLTAPALHRQLSRHLTAAVDPCAQGAPARRLLPGSSGGSEVTPSLWDLAWVPGSAQLVAAGGSRGRALLWDMRTPRAPSCWLNADRLGESLGPVQSLEATHDGKCLVAGCRSGEVRQLNCHADVTSA